MKYFVSSLSGFPSDCLCLSPFVFDWIEVGGIGWQIFQNVARIFDHRFRVGTFVKGCVVHHQDRPRWQFRYQVVAKPEIENICVNIGCGQADNQKSARQQGADDVDPSARVPVVFARTALPAQAVVSVLIKRCFSPIPDPLGSAC